MDKQSNEKISIATVCISRDRKTGTEIKRDIVNLTEMYEDDYYEPLVKIFYERMLKYGCQ